MRKLFVIIALLMIPALLFAGERRKVRKANEQTEDWRYELQNEAVGAENTALVKVWSYSKAVKVARRQATKNAIHGLIFRGAPGNTDPAKRSKTLAPLVASPEAEQTYHEFFEEFFRDGGEYQRFATITTNAEAGSVEKVGREYRVAVYVTVEYEELRRLLEKKGIIPYLPSVVEGKMPTIMVVPSDLWCIQNGYYTTVDNQGEEEKIPDYQRALQNDPNLLLVISKIGELMSERGYPLTDLESSLKRLKDEDTELLLTTSKDTGATVRETPIERLSRVAKADIWMQVTWTMNTMGPRVSITFNLQAKDAYSDKQIAASSGTCPPTFSSMIEVPVYLAEHVGANINPFTDQLMAHFKDVAKNGREIRFTCRIWDDAGFDFENEVDDEELGFLVENLVADKALNKKYTLQAASENVLKFTQIRIPLKDDKDRELDARRWANDVRRALRHEYNLDGKLVSKGLGHAILILGGK